MIRFLNVNEGKNLPLRKASEAMKRGGAVVVDYTDETLGKATANTGIYLVDVAPTYDGINAVVTPPDGSFEDIAAGQMCIEIPTYLGERYAITEVTTTGLSKGTPIVTSAGKFVKAGLSTKYEWVYGGTYADPSVAGMHIIERVPEGTTAAS